MSDKRSLAPELYAQATSKNDLRLMSIMREQDQSPVPTDQNLPAITLLVGPSPFTMPRGWEFFLTSPYEGVTYIATVLHNAGYPVRIVDVRYAVDPLNKAFRQIMTGTEVLGIATFEDNFPFTRELIAKVKEAEPKMPIICGGSLATSSPHIFMEYTKTDIAVISEGELTILELLDSYRRGKWDSELATINGISYRNDEGEVCRTAPRGQMTDLDCLPRMRLDLWPQAKDPRGLQPQIIASYSRGCKMDCAFCFRTTPQVAYKSQEKLAADLAWLKGQYNTDFIFFTDLTFNSSKQRSLDVCEVIGQYDLRWTCLTKCANVDRPQLEAMQKSGCDIALFGVESLGANALKSVRKPTTENISIKAMEMSLAAGVRFGALLIVGLPGEEADTLMHMADWAEEHNNVTRVKYLSAMPGTTVYNNVLENGQIKSELDHLNWLSVEQALYEDEFLNLSGLPEKTIRQGYKRMYDAYQPGPVMDFNHFPDNFQYFHPNPDDAKQSSIDYAGPGWRAKFSSAGPPLTPGSERFTLDQTGPEGADKVGAAEVECNAKKMGKKTKK
ncbi:MAG: B12-binding domain-containing radical SAM protein [Proteobacteria bacterium]|nr:B12-binding domain-containing radical SAM protein [Pseudomonadota bacterium]MBU1715987.1 B12-binding domain-containing radical SAM protein [Pseudomonadota bacterium]